MGNLFDSGPSPRQRKQERRQRRDAREAQELSERQLEVSQRQASTQERALRDQTAVMEADLELARKQQEATAKELEQARRRTKRRLPVDRDNMLVGRIAQRRRLAMKRKGRSSTILSDSLRERTGLNYGGTLGG